MPTPSIAAGTALQIFHGTEDEISIAVLASPKAKSSRSRISFLLNNLLMSCSVSMTANTWEAAKAQVAKAAIVTATARPAFAAIRAIPSSSSASMPVPEKIPPYIVETIRINSDLIIEITPPPDMITRKGLSAVNS